jgi:flagellar biosynthesis component FlhA
MLRLRISTAVENIDRTVLKGTRDLEALKILVDTALRELTLPADADTNLVEALRSELEGLVTTARSRLSEIEVSQCVAQRERIKSESMYTSKSQLLRNVNISEEAANTTERSAARISQLGQQAAILSSRRASKGVKQSPAQKSLKRTHKLLKAHHKYPKVQRKIPKAIQSR